MGSSGAETDAAIAALLQASAARQTGAAQARGAPQRTLMGSLFRRSTFHGTSARIDFPSADGARVPALLQRPAGPPRATLVYLHGGGWAMGSAEEYAHFTATLAEVLSVEVVSVDYRLAPAHPFPAALHDTLGALRFASGRSPMIICMGDSAGGALATTGARLHNRSGTAPPVTLQVLAYPVCDHRLESGSHRRYASGYLLTTEDMRHFWAQYCPDERMRARDDCTPMAATDLGGSPAAVVVTAGLDPIQDEGQVYAARLAASGIAVQALHFEKLPHSFLALAHRSPLAAEAFRSLLQCVDARLPPDAGFVSRMNHAMPAATSAQTAPAANASW